jgi:ParB-like chromosome segregation protein Spo0J
MPNDRSAANRLNETCYKVSNGQISKDTHRRGIESKLPWAVEMLSPHSLRPAQRNARTHSKRQIQQIAESMLRFGVINPVIVDHRRRIVAGHARAEAAKVLDLERIPIIRLSHLNETEIRAYMLADNKLPEKAGWDRETAQAFDEVLSTRASDEATTELRLPKRKMVKGPH